MTSSSVTALDTIVISFALMIVTGVVAGLMLIHGIPTENMTLLATLATGLLGLVSSYGAFRWGSSITAKKMAGTQESGE